MIIGSLRYLMFLQIFELGYNKLVENILYSNAKLTASFKFSSKKVRIPPNGFSVCKEHFTFLCLGDLIL